MSTMSQDRFNNPKYLDWVKVKLSLQYAKEGLEPSTDQKVQTFHDNLSSTLQVPSSSSASAAPTLCHGCLKSDLKRQWSRQRFLCPGGICDGWLGLLQQKHVDPTAAVEWDNFDVSRLPTSPWECAKVYMPYGSGRVNCAGDADLAAILTLFLNCHHFASSLQNVTRCEKVKEVRNRLIHSGTMEVERPQMLSDVRVIKELLSDQSFATDTACQDAITKIDKLVTDKLELSQNKELELVVLNGDIKSVADKTGQLRQGLDDLTSQVQQQHSQLTTEVSDVTTEVANLKIQLRTEVRDVTTEVASLKNQLTAEVNDVTTEVASLKTHASGVNKTLTSLDENLKASIKDIVELQRVADLLCSFINDCQIDKVDIGKLAASISALSMLKAKTDGQGQILAQLQETVDRHEVTLEQHERKLNILEAKRGRSDRQYRKVADIAALQQYLIALYKDECEWKNPMPVEMEESIPISQMYARPEMKLIKGIGHIVNPAEERQKQRVTEQLSYYKIFYTNKKDCRNIYITANAGMGKTTFCVQLLHTWCKAVQNISEEGDSAEDLNVLKQFRLLFYVNLREAESLYHIEDMIRENVLHDAPTEYNVSDILKTEKCLVVLDGLDEWSRPQGAKICRGLNKDIPGRNTMNKKCVYVTTTRNWKFCVADLEWSKDYDKQVELCGIDRKTSYDFARKVVGHLNSKSASVISRPVSGFFQEVEQKKLDSLTTVPVILIQLLTLWYFCKDLGKSQVQLYCRMLDILLKQASKHLSEETSTENQPVHVATDTTLPQCFDNEDNCQTHTQLLLCLCKLAFMSLLNKEKEDSLVFSRSRLEKFQFGQSDIELCLKCGIFTQDKGFCYPLRELKKYSFLHKKLQEFLAAVYLVTSHNVGDNMKQVREYCDKLDTTLDMGQMIMFVCGMNAEVGNLLLKHLTSVVEGDNSVQNSRQSVVGRRLMKNIQTSVMACVAEGVSNSLTIDVHPQDYCIDENTVSDYFNHVVEKKNTSIKSVYIDTYQCSKEPVTVVLKHLQKVQTLEKLLLQDLHNVVSDSSMLAPVLNTNVSTLQSLCLGGVNLAHDEALFAAVLGCVPSLRALMLGDDGEGGAVMSMGLPGHGQIEQLLAATSHLTHLNLHLNCFDHGWECKPVLDLSGHTQLQTLDMYWMCVTNLQAVAHSVKKVKLSRVTVAHSTLRKFIEALAQSSNKVQVDLWNVKFTEDSGDPADLAAYIRGCDKFTVERCDIRPDKTWDWVKFHKE